MKAEIVALCEYASDCQGHLTIVDTFETILAAKLPWRAYFYFVAKLNFEKDDKNYKTVKMRIIKDDDTKEQVFEAENLCQITADTDKVNLVAGLKGLIFTTAGRYNFHVTLDGKCVIKYPFNVELQSEAK